ncbi:DoxX protein [Sediminicurvatus halobius]|uniref:DoxX protein n=1 Tax=Sediminicurvatus halobius TaxID=2182432 RepID=A0A2U2N2T9_9GAMM|nr:DoxX protein [Spiribacter halobius]PWG63516.1 DoxX protein [Spiribacter halobius]UEX79613.1 hypothetical protein LMH63_08190 [Spiribacter halobius]
MNENRKLELGLLTLRLAMAAFMAVWALEKILHPEITQAIFQTFYFDIASTALVMSIGGVQLLIIMAFAAGLLRFWSYGAILAMHTASVLVTLGELANPYQSPNHLFWASVPTLAAMLMLFLLRDADRLLALDARRGAAGAPAESF